MNPYPIFDNDLTDEIKIKIKQLVMKERLKAVAINYHLEKKKKLDRELEELVSTKIRENENQFCKNQTLINQIILGNRAPDENELIYRQQVLTEAEKRLEKQIIPGPINQYWCTVIKNCERLSTYMNTKDQKLVEYLKCLEYQRDQKNPNNFTISMSFYMDNQNGKNAFLRGSGILRKTFIMFDAVNPLKSEVQAEFSGSIKTDSFFRSFFEPCNLEDAVDKTDDERKKIELKMGRDFEIALLFIEELIPYSLEYFLGLRTKKKKKGQGEDDDDEDEDEDDDDDVNVEDENKQQDKKKIKKDGVAVDNYECKQF